MGPLGSSPRVGHGNPGATALEMPAGAAVVSVSGPQGQCPAEGRELPESHPCPSSQTPPGRPRDWAGQGCTPGRQECGGWTHTQPLAPLFPFQGPWVGAGREA